jgi:hypothetical protein
MDRIMMDKVGVVIHGHVVLEKNGDGNSDGLCHK